MQREAVGKPCTGW